MFLQQINIHGYRSIENLELPLEAINVVTGANGAGKSNVYQAIYLIAAAAHGQLAKTLLREGGMPSALWAGERQQTTRSKAPIRLKLGAHTDCFSYELALGLPIPVQRSSYKFNLDPEVKEEYLWCGQHRKPSTTFLERQARSAWIKTLEGERQSYPVALTHTESVLSQLQEPHLYPELSSLRMLISQWRFYHTFRTDRDSPVRSPQQGVLTPVLDNEGTDLAAALETIMEIGDNEALESNIDAAFQGSRLFIDEQQGRFSIQLQQPGFKRAFTAQELSDGTLRYLCLAAALLSPRAPTFFILNEPETSLHDDLLKPLADLIIKASKDTQIMLTTHSQILCDELGINADPNMIVLEKIDGKTHWV